MKYLLIAIATLLFSNITSADQETRCVLTLETLLRQPLDVSGLIFANHFQVKLAELNLNRSDLQEILSHSFGELVIDKNNKRDYQIRFVGLFHNDGEVYRGGPVYKIVFSEDVDTKSRALEYIEIATDGAQSSYFHALADKKNGRDFLGVSFQPVKGQQSVKIEKGNLFKLRYKHNLTPKEIIEAFNNYDPRTTIEEKKKDRNTYFILYSPNNAKQLLKIVFVIENNQIVVISAYEEERTLQ